MIYIAKYNWEYSKESILKKVYKNKSIKKELNGNTSPNTDEIMFNCREFDSIKKFVMEEYFMIKNMFEADYAFNMWSYIQTKDTNDEIFHQHLRVDGGRSEIPADYTFVFYLQIPENLNDGDGYLLLKNEDGTIREISPNEGEIIFFPANMWHTPTMTPSAKLDRVVIAGNISLNFLTKKNLV